MPSRSSIPSLLRLIVAPANCPRKFMPIGPRASPEVPNCPTEPANGGSCASGQMG